MLPAISRQFAAMSTCRPSCSRLNFNEQASPLLKGYVIERRSCDLAPMPCFLPLPVNLPIGTSIGVPTAMRALQPSSARHRCRREVIVTTFLVIGRGGRLACLPPSQFRLARGRPCATVMANHGTIHRRRRLMLVRASRRHPGTAIGDTDLEKRRSGIGAGMGRRIIRRDRRKHWA